MKATKNATSMIIFHLQTIIPFRTCLQISITLCTTLKPTKPQGPHRATMQIITMTSVREEAGIVKEAEWTEGEDSTREVEELQEWWTCRSRDLSSLAQEWRLLSHHTKLYLAIIKNISMSPFSRHRRAHLWINWQSWVKRIASNSLGIHCIPK